MSTNNRARRKKKELANKRREKRLRKKLMMPNDEPGVVAYRLSVEDDDASETDDRELKCLDWEITDEPMRSNRPAEVDELATKGFECLEDGEFVEAEALFRKAVDLCPDAPDLWNNLAAALEGLGQQREALEISDMLRLRFPEYFFGIIRETSRAIDRGDVDHARSLLLALTERKRLHTTEFRALITAHLKLAAASNEFAAAKSWLKLWKDVEDHPLQIDFAQRIRFRQAFSPKGIGKFIRWLFPHRQSGFE